MQRTRLIGHRKSGKHLTANPPFGFVKDAEDKDKWLIDEEAAQTVRYIFKLCYNAPDKSSGHRKQKIEIYCKATGIINIAIECNAVLINIADEDCVALDSRLGMQNRKKKTA